VTRNLAKYRSKIKLYDEDIWDHHTSRNLIWNKLNRVLHPEKASMEMSVLIYSLSVLSLGKKFWSPTERRLCGPRKWSACCGEKFLATIGNRTLTPRLSIPWPGCHSDSSWIVTTEHDLIHYCKLTECKWNESLPTTAGTTSIAEANLSRK
jgi:hypothetical protein